MVTGAHAILAQHPHRRDGWWPSSVLSVWILRGLVASSVLWRASAEDGTVPALHGSQFRSVFAFPRIQTQVALLHAEMVQAFEAGRYPDAEQACRRSIALQPEVPTPYYNLACALARQNRVEEALEVLGQAVQRGFNDLVLLDRDPDLAPLRTQAAWSSLREAARRAPPFSPERRVVTPTPPHEGIARVSETNTGWHAMLGVLQAYFVFPPSPPYTGSVVRGEGPAEQRLRRWYQEGTAPGNWGDLYDNRDGGHSALDGGKFPLLTRIQYAPEAESHEVHRGLQLHFLFNRVTFGNASLANTSGWMWRSMPRYAYPDSRLMAILYAQYASHHLYVYPEHRDYDPGRNGEGGGYGDVFCANTPYVIISQGSSGSDRPFVEAIAFTLASFRPEVKKRLVSTASLMPTVQMILRASSRRVTRRDDYLTGQAHPVVFDAKDLDLIRMMEMAHEMTPDNLPPVVRIRVVEEDEAIPGRDYFDPRPTERLFDTPAAVARVARSLRYWRRMVVSTEGSYDPNDRRLRFHWRVLNGDADRTRIRPADAAGTRAEILIPYHERHPVYPGAPIEGNRVDIGVFADNGEHFSAPAFISVFYLDNERRVYDERRRILSVQYSGAETPGPYVDPLIDLPKDWLDEYHYDSQGRLAGWTRTLGGTRQEFTEEGRLIVRRDESGRPVETRPVRYTARRLANGRLVLDQQVIP